MNYSNFEDYTKFYAFDNSFIHFSHSRTGDREGIYDEDLSLGKTESGWLLTLERKMKREQSDDADGFVYDFNIDDIILKEDFFEKYSKKEFTNILKAINTSNVASKIPSDIKFNSKGISTEWSEYPGWSDLKTKEYLASKNIYSACIPQNLLPLVNSICRDLNIDLIRSGIYFNFFMCLKDKLGIICHGEKYFVYKVSEEIEVYGKYNEYELKQCLAKILNLKNINADEKILNKKKIFKTESSAKKFLKTE